MLQVQVLVQQHGAFNTALFKKIKVSKWEINELQAVYPSTGSLEYTSANTMIMDDFGYKVIYIKQMYVN
jgi:hypothetical protein